MTLTLEETKNLLRKGLIYIGYPIDEKVGINMELLINVREYISDQSDELYKKLFLEAYNFDIGVDRETDDAYYEDDGIQYFFKNDNMEVAELEKYKLFRYGFKTEIVTLESPIKCKLNDNYKKQRNHYYYKYMNEIDHFFTNCINNCMLGIGCQYKENRKKYDLGRVLIMRRIEEEYSENKEETNA